MDFNFTEEFKTYWEEANGYEGFVEAREAFEHQQEKIDYLLHRLNDPSLTDKLNDGDRYKTTKNKHPYP